MFQLNSITEMIMAVMILFDGPKKRSIIIKFITTQVNVITFIKKVSKFVGIYLSYIDKKQNHRRIRKI